jgi:hypothetical protein
MESVINLDSQPMKQTVQAAPGKTVICFYMNPDLFKLKMRQVTAVQVSDISMD